jgi:hypothetical protein
LVAAFLASSSIGDLSALAALAAAALGAATFFGVATGEAGLFFGVAGFFALEALTATGLVGVALLGEVAGYFGTINAG